MNKRRNPFLWCKLSWCSLALLSYGAFAQTQPDYLPADAAVREAISHAPAVGAAMFRRDAAQARGDGVRAGSAETVVRTSFQRRKVHEPAENLRETQVMLERPLRLWGKATADAQLADTIVEGGAIALDDARHETARELLGLWFGALRARQVRLAAQRNYEAATELAQLTARRFQLGDAPRMEAELADAERARTQALLAAAVAADEAAAAELRGRFPGLAAPQHALDHAELPPLPAEPAGQLRAAYIDGSHARRMAVNDEQYAQRQARRADLARHPDPTVGVFMSTERGGAEHVMGVSVSMPLGSAYRRSTFAADAAEAEAAVQRRIGETQRIGAEFDVLYQQLVGRRQAAQAQAEALTLQRTAAERATRAWRAGETGLAELLPIRRSLYEATLAQRLALVDALETDSRFRLDMHQLWDFD